MVSSFSPVTVTVLLVGVVGDVILTVADAPSAVLVVAGISWGLLSVTAHGAVFVTWWRRARFQSAARTADDWFWVPDAGINVAETAIWAVLSVVFVLVAALVVLTT